MDRNSVPSAEMLGRVNELAFNAEKITHGNPSGARSLQCPKLRLKGPVSDKGMHRLLNKLAEEFIQAKPMRAAELFDNVFYSASAWRQGGESIQGYIVHREKEVADLKAVSADTALSDDIQAYLLLKFSGVSPKAIPAVIGSADN